VLKEYDEMLSEYNFIRVHRTHLVNRNYINSISGDHQLMMSDNSRIEISRRKWDDVKKKFWLAEEINNKHLLD
jgi:two-component system LytT family response regulator